jgi:hypothetical protein
MRTYIKIANAHLEAKLHNKFTNPSVSTREQMMDALMNGDTFEALMEQIETRYVSVTSQLYSSVLGYTTEAYKKSIRRGFKQLIQCK